MMRRQGLQGGVCVIEGEHRKQAENGEKKSWQSCRFWFSRRLLQNSAANFGPEPQTIAGRLSEKGLYASYTRCGARG
jgi:hypothetical protein